MAKYKNSGRLAMRKQGGSAPRISSQAPVVRDVMDIKDLAHYLDMGKSKIYALIRQKKIPASRIGRQYRFSKNIVDQWLSERLITQNPDSQMPLFTDGLR